MQLLQEAHFWEGAGLALLVLVLIWAKLPQRALAALDARAEAVKSQLDQAARLREEAERLLAEIHAQRQSAEHQAEEILALARAEAERHASESRTKLEEQIRRRAEQAERRIALAESQAAAEVRAAAAELAAQATETVLTQRLAETRADPLIDPAVAQLASKFQ